MTAAQRPPRARVPPVDRHLLDAVVASAEADAGAPQHLLGSYVRTSATCAVRGTRLARSHLDEIRRLGELAAEEGVELRRLLDLYLSATWRLSEHLARSAPGSSWATALFRVSDDAAAALGEGFDRAQRRAIRREEAIRRELIDDVLSGVAVGAPLRDLAAQVGFNLAGEHQVVVARTDRPLRDAGPVHAHVERELVAARRGVGFVATKEGQLVCVLAGRAPGAGDAVRRLTTSAAPGRWVVGVGHPHSGPGGVARSFREARDALDVAAQLQLTTTVVHIGDLLPYRLLVQDRALLAETVGEVLAGLGSARGGAEPLVETLEAYFDEALSTTATARRLHLSVRAVTYRLDRIATLTGRSLRDPVDRFALEVAVRGRRLLDHRFQDPATEATDVDPSPR